MTSVIATKGVSHVIDDIISRANKYVILVSPYIKISRSFLNRLQVVSNRGISITFVYGKKSLPNFKKTKFTNSEGVESFLMKISTQKHS